MRAVCPPLALGYGTPSGFNGWAAASLGDVGELARLWLLHPSAKENDARATAAIDASDRVEQARICESLTAATPFQCHAAYGRVKDDLGLSLSRAALANRFAWLESSGATERKRRRIDVTPTHSRSIV
jgi:tRNA C32,U32 (ribose-2'-O)-methylase TrmJ